MSAFTPPASKIPSTPSKPGQRKPETAETTEASGPAPPKEPTQKSLRKQLGAVHLNMARYEHELEIKDDQIIQTNQEIERLNIRYHDMVEYIESDEPALPVLKEASKKHIEKMNRQRVQIDNLQLHNLRLKDMLQRARIPLDSEMDWAALRSECKAHREFFMKQGGNEEMWKENWETNGRGHAPWPGHTNLGVRGVNSSDIVDPGRRQRRNKKRNSENENSQINNDPRSPWQRRVAEQEIDRPSPRKEDTTSFLARMPWTMDVVGHDAEEGRGPLYSSQNQFATYRGREEIETKVADRLDKGKGK